MKEKEQNVIVEQIKKSIISDEKTKSTAAKSNEHEQSSKSL